MGEKVEEKKVEEEKFQDRGKYVYANGDEFLGTWDRGNKVQGTFYFKDGRTSTRRWLNGTLVSSQDFDPRRRSYNPTISKQRVHAPDRCRYGASSAQVASPMGVVSPRGVRN